MATCADDTPSDYDHEKPNHIILWLDVEIGDPTKYLALKKSFSSNTDPLAQTWTMFTDRDIDRLLQVNEAQIVRFEGVVFLLQAFQTEEACLEAFEIHQDKRIFFITSGSLGRYAVPQIIARFRRVFIDPITNESYSSIFVFCHDIARQMDWADDYLEYLQMFNFDSELLERMIRDVAEYFIERSARLRQDQNYSGAKQRLQWGKKLRTQYDKMIQGFNTDDPTAVVRSERMRQIDILLGEIEQLYADQEREKWKAKFEQNRMYPDEKRSDDDDDTKCSEPCG